MDAKARIEAAKVKLKRAEQEKTVKETQKKAAEEQRDDVIAKMTAEGVTPETIKDEIDRLEKEIDEKLTQAESLTPAV